MFKIGLPPPSDISEHIGYNPETGVFTRLKCHKLGLIGGRADVVSSNGYRRIHFRRREYSGQRLAWYFETGGWPADEIDHINGNPSDNRIANLRVATRAQNCWNRVRPGLRPKGVTKLKSGQYRANITAHGRTYYLGQFRSPEDAHAAYAEAAKKHHGTFARLA
jgi:hypothetical protein